MLWRAMVGRNEVVDSDDQDVDVGGGGQISVLSIAECFRLTERKNCEDLSRQAKLRHIFYPGSTRS